MEKSGTQSTKASRIMATRWTPTRAPTGWPIHLIYESYGLRLIYEDDKISHRFHRRLIDMREIPGVLGPIFEAARTSHWSIPSAPTSIMSP